MGKATSTMLLRQIDDDCPRLIMCRRIRNATGPKSQPQLTAQRQGLGRNIQHPSQVYQSIISLVDVSLPPVFLDPVAKLYTPKAKGIAKLFRRNILAITIVYTYTRRIRRPSYTRLLLQLLVYAFQFIKVRLYVRPGFFRGFKAILQRCPLAGSVERNIEHEVICPTLLADLDFLPKLIISSSSIFPSLLLLALDIRSELVQHLLIRV